MIRAALSLLVFGSSCALGGGLELEGRIGLGGRATFGDHAAVSIRIRLPEGEPTFRGRLRIGVVGLQLSGTELSLSLAPGSERRVRLAIPYVRNSVHTLRLVEDPGGEDRTLSAELSDDTQQLDERSVVLLGTEGWPALTANDKVTLIHVAPEDLPRDARAISGLGALVVPLRGEAREHLHEASFAATLRDYVRGGGVVLFCGRSDAPRVWVGGPLEPLLPVRNPTASSAKAERVAAFLGELEVPALPCVQADLAPGARWRERNEELGLLAELPIGAGVTRFLAFDPDERGPRGASGLPGVLRTVSSPETKRSSPRVRRYDLGSVARLAFEARPALSALEFALVVGVVVVHALIAVALGVVLRRRKRQPWLALLIPPALSGVLGTVVIVIAAASQGGPEARALVLVAQPEPQSAGPVPARVLIGLFSDRETTLRLDLAGWSPEPTERGVLEALQFRAHPPWVREEGSGKRWLGPIQLPGHGHSRWACTGEAKGLPLSVQFSGGSWEISAAEQIQGLSGVMIAPNGTVSALTLGDVGPGQTVVFDPSKVRGVVAVDTLDSDPFTSASGLDALREFAFAQLSARRRAGKKNKDPTFALVHLGRRPLGLPSVSQIADEHEPISLDPLVLTIVDLETP
ncbi:MAG: hypothetical protein JKY65_15535 [Planctomycetes bacterium]|nr:hypothetical protein [Planctomycetota bacterium]